MKISLCRLICFWCISPLRFSETLPGAMPNISVPSISIPVSRQTPSTRRRLPGPPYAFLIEYAALTLLTGTSFTPDKPCCPLSPHRSPIRSHGDESWLASSRSPCYCARGLARGVWVCVCIGEGDGGVWVWERIASSNGKPLYTRERTNTAGAEYGSAPVRIYALDGVKPLPSENGSHFGIVISTRVDSD